MALSKGNENQINNKENLHPSSKFPQNQKPSLLSSSNAASARATLSASIKPLPGMTMKRSRTPLKGAENAELKSRLRFGNHLPLKRPSYSVDHNDDF